MPAPFHEVTVAERRWLSTNMVRLGFTAPSLARFRSTGIGDEYLRLFFPDEATGELVLPIIGADGSWRYDEDKPPVRCSTYTVRRFDRGEQALEIDFVAHAGGMASDWARTAAVGERIVINEPRALFTPPKGMQWLVLLADSTGLPALCRLLEQVPGNLPCRVVAETLDGQERALLPAHPRCTVTWISGSGNGLTRESRLAAAFRALPMPRSPGYVWAAAERRAIRGIRKHARNVLRLPAAYAKLVAYWIDDRTEWLEEDPDLDPKCLEALSAAWPAI